MPLIAVVGAHLGGEPLNRELTDRGGTLVRTTRTARCYRMYALKTNPPKPGLVRVEPGDEEAGDVEVEVWALPAGGFGMFVDGVTAPMVIGRVVLADGSDVAGFLCEPIALEDAVDITGYGGWRRYLGSAH